MIDIIQPRLALPTYAVVGLSAALAAGGGQWATKDYAYTVRHSERTYSSFQTKLELPAGTITRSFGQRIAAIYAALSEGQEPLGPELEAIWDANLESLYEA